MTVATSLSGRAGADAGRQRVGRCDIVQGGRRTDVVEILSLRARVVGTSAPRVRCWLAGREPGLLSRLLQKGKSMSPKPFVAALVIVGMMGATVRAYGQMPPPAPPQQAAPYPPPGYPPPGYPPPGYPGQYAQPLNPGPQPPASAVAPN